MVIALVGDYSSGYEAQAHTIRALDELDVAFEWVSTADIDDTARPQRLHGHAGIVMTPGTPYASLGGALAAIRYAREEDVPLFGA